MPLRNFSSAAQAIMTALSGFASLELSCKARKSYFTCAQGRWRKQKPHSRATILIQTCSQPNPASAPQLVTMTLALHRCLKKAFEATPPLTTKLENPIAFNFCKASLIFSSSCKMAEAWKAAAILRFFPSVIDDVPSSSRLTADFNPEYENFSWPRIGTLNILRSTVSSSAKSSRACPAADASPQGISRSRATLSKASLGPR